MTIFYEFIIIAAGHMVTFPGVGRPVGNSHV
jgi:hypothetical protein